MYANRQISRVEKEIGVEENDDARFKSGRGNMTVSCMRNASRHNYRNSSFIVILRYILRNYITLGSVKWLRIQSVGISAVRHSNPEPVKQSVRFIQCASKK